MNYWKVFTEFPSFISTFFHEAGHYLASVFLGFETEMVFHRYNDTWAGYVLSDKDGEVLKSSKFIITAMGPIFSILMATIFFVLSFLVLPDFFIGIFLFYIGIVNLRLAHSSLIPIVVRMNGFGYPTDGHYIFSYILSKNWGIIKYILSNGFILIRWGYFNYYNYYPKYFYQIMGGIIIYWLLIEFIV